MADLEARGFFLGVPVKLGDEAPYNGPRIRIERKPSVIVDRRVRIILALFLFHPPILPSMDDSGDAFRYTGGMKAELTVESS